METSIIALLDDGETFSAAYGSSIVSVEADDADDIETLLSDEDYSNVASFTFDENGALIIHIHDASGITVIINDERRGM